MTSNVTESRLNHTNVELEDELEDNDYEGRLVEGAEGGDDVAIPADTLSYAAHQISIPACPEGYETFIEETSLERLVYWKLQGLFEKFDEDPPNNILRTVLAHVERPLFALVLKKTRGNQSKAAEVLGCNRNTLHRKLKGFSIQPKDLRKALKNKATRTPEEVFEELVRQDS
jgi:DNA-binding protein Fis